MLKTGDSVTTIRPLKVTITRIGMQDAIGSMTLSPGTFTVEDFAFDEDIFGWIDLNVPGLDSVIITATQEDFEDACYNESDFDNHIYKSIREAQRLDKERRWQRYLLELGIVENSSSVSSVELATHRSDFECLYADDLDVNHTLRDTWPNKE